MEFQRYVKSISQENCINLLLEATKLSKAHQRRHFHESRSIHGVSKTLQSSRGSTLGFEELTTRPRPLVHSKNPLHTILCLIRSMVVHETAWNK